MSNQAQHNLKALVLAIEEILGRARKQLNALETYEFDGRHDQADPNFEADVEYEIFESQLIEAFRLLRLAYEAGGLPLTRATVSAEWESLALKIRSPKYIHEHDVLYSEPFSYLRDALDGLQKLVLEPKEQPRQVDLNRLATMLHSLGTMVQRRFPAGAQSENDVQTVMDDYLSAAFPDYKPQPVINGQVKEYRMDGGVRQLRTGIELKFADSPAAMKKAVDEVLVDTRAYQGSAFWERFFAVFFMTGPHEQAARVQYEFDRVGATDWTVVAVNGGAAAHGPKSKKAKSTGTTPASVPATLNPDSVLLAALVKAQPKALGKAELLGITKIEAKYWGSAIKALLTAKSVVQDGQRGGAKYRAT